MSNIERDDREPIPDTVQDFADWADGPEVTSSPLVGEVQRLRRELAGVVEALQRYGDHLPDCTTFTADIHGGCSCGLTETLATYGGQ